MYNQNKSLRYFYDSTIPTNKSEMPQDDDKLIFKEKKLTKPGKVNEKTSDMRIDISDKDGRTKLVDSKTFK